MADTTKLTIELQVLLRNLQRTLRGLGQIEQRLQRIASIRVNTATSAAANRQAVAAQRLANQQQRLAIQTQELANRQERARQASERLALSQRRLEQAQRRATEASRGLNLQQDRHVQVFRAMERASQSFNRSLGALGNSLRSVGQGLASVGATLTFSVTAPLAALSASVVDAAVRMDSLKRGLTTIAGSSQEAAQQLERLTQIAKLPGIGFQEAIQGSIRLQAVGFSAEEAERSLRQFSNAIALTGGGRENLETVTVQLGQMAAQSKVLAADLKPIINAAPAVAVALREAFGTVRSEELQELGISSKEFIGILVSELERLPRAAAGARNSFENFRDELFRAAATVGTVLLPALTRLVEVAGPIITTLANAFAAIPAPLQVIVIGFTALLAALGPVLFIVGQLVLGVGRLLTGFVQLNAQGILPTIASMRALAVSTAAALNAQRGLVVTTAALGGGLVSIVAILGAVLGAFALYKAFQKDSITLSREQVDALTDQIAGLKEQAKFVAGLSAGVERTADEQQRLLDIYSELNREAKVRVTGIIDEEQRLVALREEIARIIALREQERIQQAAAIVGELANNLLRVESNKQARDAIASQIQANSFLIGILQEEQSISERSAQALKERAIGVTTVEDAIRALRAQSEHLSINQDKLIASSKELNDLTEDQVATVRALEQQTGLTARELLVAAQSMGRFRGDVAAIIPVLERYIRETDAATKSTDRFNRSLSENERRLNEAGKRANEVQKARQTVIASAAALAREASNSFEGALKFMRAFIEANPELRAAIERESQIAGKSFDDFVRESLEKAFGRGRGGTETTLRNAQEQLQRALAERAQASAEELAAIEIAKNERLLQANENLFRLQLISYRQYLSERARLTNANLQLEINAQRALASAAADERDRLIKRSQQAGVPPAESTRARAQAAQAEAQRIDAETRIVALQGQQRQLVDEVAQSLAEAQRQQFEDVRKLEGEYAELRGRIEDALNAATDERFRESLQALSIAQDDLNKRLRLAREIGDAAAEAEIKQAQALNQRQIDAIEGIVAQERATNKLVEINEFVRRAKEEQAELERQLGFEVEFRGLKEETAIARRLAGERRLAVALTLERDIVQATIDKLESLAIPVPQTLLETVRDINAAIAGLGELTFTEQFRLAEKEFNRLNDERIQKIQDVERAINNRNISEAEGLIFIRRINGEYVGDLERQLELLKQIATASGDANLQRQAQSAEETVKDAGDQLASFDKQLRATSIDALRDGFVEFFQSLRDNTISAQEKLLNLIDSVVARINEVIAENLFDELMKSIFGDGTGGEGIIASIKRLFGFGGGDTGGGIAEEAATHAADIAQAHTLEAGAVVAATTFTAGVTTASTTFAASVTAAATSFASLIISAGIAFAASATAGATAQAIGGAGGAAGGLLGGAASGLFPAVPGGVYKFVEGGHPEAVLTTDPKHAARQVAILRAFLRETRGLGGRIKSFAAGAMINPSEALMSGMSVAGVPGGDVGSMVVAGAPSEMRLRQVLVSENMLPNWVNSSEGEKVLVDFLYKNQATMRKITGGRK